MLEFRSLSNALRYFDAEGFEVVRSSCLRCLHVQLTATEPHAVAMFFTEPGGETFFVDVACERCGQRPMEFIEIVSPCLQRTRPERSRT